MKSPARAIIGNCVWTHDNTVWAVWHLRPRNYLYLTAEEQLGRHREIADLLAAVPKRALLAGICEHVDPEDQYLAALAGIDTDSAPGYVEQADAWLDWLCEHDLYRRRHFIAIELPASRTQQWRRRLRAATSDIAGYLQFAPPSLRPDELADAQSATASIEAALTQSGIAVRPAEPAFVRWLYQRHPRRGHESEAPFDQEWDPPRQARKDGHVLTASLAAFDDAVLREGGDPDDPSRPRNPFQRSYLHCQTPFGEGYQQSLILADTPRAWWFPGGLGEMFVRTDNVSFPLDYFVRIEAIDNDLAKQQARRDDRTISHQFDEWEDDPSGAPQDLYDAKQAIQDERDTLSSNPSERELQCQVIFQTWAATTQEVTDQAAAIRRVYEPAEYTLPAPTGEQTKLHHATKIGSELDRSLAREYRQFWLQRDLAAQMPLVDVEVGDPDGILLGVTLAGATSRPVFLQPSRAPRIDRSGCAYFSGILGQGKSYTAKVLLAGALESGDVAAFTVDRTRMGEYVRFAGGLECSTQVVSLDDSNADVDLADVCIDPMRIFSGKARIDHTRDFLMLLTRSGTQEPEGVAIATAIRTAAQDPSATLRDVLDTLAAAASSNAAAATVSQKVAAHIGEIDEDPLARVVFGTGTPLKLHAADYTIFHLPGMELPRRTEIASEHRARHVSLPRLLGEAVYFLSMMIGREIIYTRASSEHGFGILHTDEFAAFVRSEVGRAAWEELARDSRKHNVALWALSQFADDTQLGSDADAADLDALIGYRFVFGQTKRSEAETSIRSLGREPTDELVDAVMSMNQIADDTDTQQSARVCLMRDLQGRVAPVLLLPAALERLHTAFETNPDRVRAAAASEPAEDLSEAVLPDDDKVSAEVDAELEQFLAAVPAGEDLSEAAPPDDDAPEVLPAAVRVGDLGAAGIDGPAPAVRHL